MQENKNNALEKAENIANKPSASTQTKQNKQKAKKSQSHSKSKTKSVSAQQKISAKEQRKLEKQKKKEQKQKALAQKRVELAKIRAHKKAEKQKAKATALREKNRRKAEAKQRKQLLKEQRIARRQMIKNESKKERQKRIALERQQLREERQHVREQKAQKKREQRAHRLELRRQKQAERSQRRKDRQRHKERNRGYGGWLAAVISLGLSTLVLASVLTFTFLMPTTNEMALESSYQRAFYDAVQQVENIDLNLSKALMSKDGNAIQKYLLDTAINSELAENDLQELPLDDEYKFHTAKIVNQIGDFSKYIINKLIDGENLTAKDKQDLQNLYNANLSLKQALGQMTEKMGNDYSFQSLISGGKGDVVLSGFNELQNLSVSYPQLIYDGPFSDGQQEKPIKGLGTTEISEQQAQEIFAKIFSDYSFSKIESAGMTDGSMICYNIQGIVDDNILYAQISKNDGKLIMFSFAGDCSEVSIQDDEAIQKGSEFLQKMGVENMQEVWINLANNVYTINYAYQIDDTIIYPDMIKVRVCAKTGNVIGIEAKSYYTNHTQRKLDGAKITQGQAKQNVFDDLQIESVRQVVIPLTQNTEKLCYEFSGQFDGNTYYVYIDAINGHQLQMFKVVKGTEGTLLM